MHSVPPQSMAPAAHPQNLQMSGGVSIQSPQPQQTYVQQHQPVHVLQQHQNVQSHQQVMQSNMQQPQQQTVLQHPAPMPQQLPSNIVSQQQAQPHLNTQFSNNSTIASQSTTGHIYSEPGPIYQVRSIKLIKLLLMVSYVRISMIDFVFSSSNISQ